MFWIVTWWHFQSTSKEVIWPIFLFELHAWVKKGHFGNFSERTETAAPCIIELTTLFVLGADKYLERLEGKIRNCSFLFNLEFRNFSRFIMLKYSKITVWTLRLGTLQPNQFTT